MTVTDRRRLIEALIAAGRRLDALGLVPARDGNLSARSGAGRVLITATGARKRALTAEDFAEVATDGRPIAGARASTELGMHLTVYRLRPDVGAIVHAHPPVAVGFASAGLGLTECLMPEVAMSLGGVPLTPYATPGTPEIETAIADAARVHDAFLLANYGAVTLGGTVDEALDRMETLEHFARIALVTRLLGGGRPLGPAEVAALETLRRSAGDPRPITCEPESGSEALARPAPCSLNRPQPAAPQSTSGDFPDPGRLADAVTEAVRALLGGPAPRTP
jgi:L-fuculose-phosphate aldolase